MIGLAMAPYFALVMEPIEDACMKALTVPIEQVKKDLFLVFYGHVAVVIVLGSSALLELDWKIVGTSNSKKKQ